MYQTYKKIEELHLGRKETGEHLAQVEKVGSKLIDRIKADHPEEKPKEEKQKKKSNLKSKEEKVVAKTEKVIDNLTNCRRLIREERKRKIEKGEIKAPVKQTPYTKIKGGFIRILKAIPAESVETIKETKKALTESLKKIFAANGWKRWKVIDEMLQEIADKQIKKIEKVKN